MNYDEMLDNDTRTMTAALILAALVSRGPFEVPNVDGLSTVELSVSLADQLVKELRKERK